MTVDIDEQIIEQVTLEKIIESSKNISDFLQDTPTISIDGFIECFNHDVFFKLENLQKTGSFKIRGVINALVNLKKNNALPNKIVSYGSGNHGIALAWASKAFGIKEIKLYLPHSVAKIKRNLAHKYGAKIIQTKTISEAKKLAETEANIAKYTLIAPSNNNDIITGAATVAYESLQTQQGFEAIFIPMAGVDLSAGTLITKNYLSPTTKVYAGEPKEINDDLYQYKPDTLSQFEEALHTIADGTAALGITKKIFNHVKHLDGVYKISEKEIKYWTTQFYKFTKNFCEPSSALALAAAHRWLEIQEDETRKKILIIVTGSNISSATQKKILHSKLSEMTPSELNFHNKYVT
ncbi:MAG: pyridoxal-phosphate dependent enzyme [Rickettsiales bacterium]|nr:pyridoxal-phosphate dependent enzyme [Rickettsiales bacterium]